MVTMTANIFKKGDKCFADSGCYAIYELKGGYDLEADTWINITIFNHVTSALTAINSRFSKAAERDKVVEILEELDNHTAPFTCDVRFPERGIFIRLNQGPYDSIITQLTSAAAYVDTVTDRQNQSSILANSTKVAPSPIDLILKHEREYSDAKRSFEKSLAALKSYARSAHRYRRFKFETDFNMVWCCNMCCPKKICVQTCTDKFVDKRCDIIHVEPDPKDPSDPKDPEEPCDDCDSCFPYTFMYVKNFLRTHPTILYTKSYVDKYDPTKTPKCDDVEDLLEVDKQASTLILETKPIIWELVSSTSDKDNYRVYRLHCTKSDNKLNFKLQMLDTFVCDKSFQKEVQILDEFMSQTSKSVDREAVYYGDSNIESCSFSSANRLTNSIKILKDVFIFARGQDKPNKIFIYEPVQVDGKYRFIYITSRICDEE